MRERQRNSIVAAFCVAHGLCLFALGVANQARIDWLTGLSRGLLMSQIALLATWTALGKAHGRFIKATLLFIAVSMLNIVAGMPLTSGYPATDMFFTLAIITALGAPYLLALSLPWKMLTRRGFKLIDADETPQQLDDEGFQFSLRQAFAWTTIVALLFAIGQWIPPLGEIDAGQIQTRSLIGGLVVLGGFLLQLITVMLLAGWAILSPGHFWPRLLAVIVAASILGTLPPYYFRGGMREYAIFIGMTVSYGAILSSSLLLFRAYGYRLVRGNAGRLRRPSRPGRDAIRLE